MNNNAWFITNIMLLRLSHLMINRLSYVLLPVPNVIGSQNQKVNNLYHYINDLNNTDFKNELATCVNDLDGDIDYYTDEKLLRLKRHILELIELYFPKTDEEYLKYAKAKIDINYTPRHYIASFFLKGNYALALEINDIFAKKWEFIWDAQVHDLNKKLQLFKEILRLPSSERIGKEW